LGSRLKNQPDGFTNFFAEHQQQHQQHHPQPLNLVLFIELTVACCWGMYHAGTMGKATSGKITELGLYTTMLLGMDTARKIHL
jgi:hypothetical protein